MIVYYVGTYFQYILTWYTITNIHDHLTTKSISIFKVYVIACDICMSMSEIKFSTFDSLIVIAFCSRNSGISLKCLIELLILRLAITKTFSFLE